MYWDKWQRKPITSCLFTYIWGSQNELEVYKREPENSVWVFGLSGRWMFRSPACHLFIVVQNWLRVWCWECHVPFPRSQAQELTILGSVPTCCPSPSLYGGWEGRRDSSHHYQDVPQTVIPKLCTWPGDILSDLWCDWGISGIAIRFNPVSRREITCEKFCRLHHIYLKYLCLY